jgi:hypothetical protein
MINTSHYSVAGVVKVGLQEMQHQHPQLTSRIARSFTFHHTPEAEFMDVIGTKV